MRTLQFTWNVLHLARHSDAAVDVEVCIPVPQKKSVQGYSLRRVHLQQRRDLAPLNAPQLRPEQAVHQAEAGGHDVQSADTGQVTVQAQPQEGRAAPVEPPTGRSLPGTSPAADWSSQTQPFGCEYAAEAAIELGEWA